MSITVTERQAQSFTCGLYKRTVSYHQRTERRIKEIEVVGSTNIILIYFLNGLSCDLFAFSSQSPEK